mgnify:CR=1 FL=1
MGAREGNDAVSKLLLLLPVALLASPAQAEAKKEQPDPNKKVCKYERDTGSRIVSRKICMTRAEWDEQARTVRDDISGSRNRTSLGVND